MSFVRVRLKTANARLYFEGGESLFQRGVEPLLVHLARGPRATPARVVPAAAEEVPVAKTPGYSPPMGSFGTFQRQLDPALDGAASRIPAYAFFLWNYEKKEIFSEEEVRGCFRADGRDLPEDTEALYGNLAEQRILERAGDGGWILTSKGLSHARKALR